VAKFDTGHRANVFQVQYAGLRYLCKFVQTRFMPHSGDTHIVTCSRDSEVRLATLSTDGSCKGTRLLARHSNSAHKVP